MLGIRCEILCCRGAVRLTFAFMGSLLLGAVCSGAGRQAKHSCHLWRRHGQGKYKSLYTWADGYMTPNIDSIGEQGMTFTDYYAENSCTAGRATFITGQSRLVPGSVRSVLRVLPVGLLQKRDITIAEALKPLGYSTGQFGKNHLGDRDEYSTN